MSDNAMIVIICVQFFLLGLILYCMYLVTNGKTDRNFAKWLMLIASIGILSLADKFKLIAWVIIIALTWVFKYKKNKNELT